MANDSNIMGLILEIKDRATPILKGFGNSLKIAGQGITNYAKEFDKAESTIEKSLKKQGGMIKQWKKELDSVLSKTLSDPTSSEAGIKAFMSPLQKQTAMQEARLKKFQENIHKASNRYHSMIMGSVALSMTGIGMENFGRPIIQGFDKMIQQAGDFQEAMRKIQLTTDDYNKSTGKALENANKLINQSVMSAGIASPLSNKDMSEMAYTLSTMGFHDAKSLNSLIAPAMLLQANSSTEPDGGLSTTQASQLVSNLLIQSGRGIGKTSDMTLAGQKFSGVSSTGISVVDQMTKSLHDAHLTYQDILGFQSSAGSSLATSKMGISDFLALGGAMKREGIQVRTGGRDIQGLINRVGLMDAQNATKPTILSKQAEELGLTMTNLRSGDFIDKLNEIIDKAQKKYGSKYQEVLGRLSNTTGKNVFTALDNLNQQRAAGNVQMNASEMAKDIAQSGSDGEYSKKRFDELSKQFPMAWKQFKGTMESIGQVIGGSILPPITSLIIKLTDLGGKFIEFAQQHPTLIKILGVGTGLAGLFTVATGAAFLFVGQILSGFASLANFRLQLATATATTDTFVKGMKSATDVLAEGGFTGWLKNGTLALGGVTAALGAAYLIWTNDIGGIKTAVTDLGTHIKDSWSNMVGMLNAYDKDSQESFMRQRTSLKGSANDWYKFATFLVDAALVFKTVTQFFRMQDVPIDKFKMLKDEGLVPLVETLFNLKNEARTFFQGFKEGFKGFTDVLGGFLAPFKPVAEAILKFFHLDGLLDGGKGAKDLTSFGQSFGTITKYVLAGLIALRVYSKTLKGMFSFGGKAVDLGKMIKNQDFKGIATKLKDSIISGSKGVLAKTLGKDAVAVASILRKELSKAISSVDKSRGMNIRRDRGVTHYGPLTLDELRKFNGHSPLSVFDQASKGRLHPPVVNRPTHYDVEQRMYNPGGKDYADWWYSQTLGTRPLGGGKTLNSTELRRLEAMQGFAPDKVRRDIAARALDAHHRGVLNAGYDDIVQAYDRGDHKFLRSKKGKGQGISGLAGMTGRGLMKGFGLLGTGLAIAGGAPDIINGFVSGGFNKGMDAIGGTLGIGAKGGLGGAASGAMNGAMMGMMFGPIGAAVGAAIGGALGGIGMDRIKEGIQKAGTVISAWWKDFTDSDLGKTLIGMFGNWWDTFKNIAVDAFHVLKDLFTGDWKSLGKDIGKIWTDWYDGFKKQLGLIWTYLGTTTIGKAVAKIFGWDTSKPAESQVPVDGNHASGLPYVPYDGYRAELHRGEMVLTENDASSLRKAQSQSAPASTSAPVGVNFEKGAIQISMANSSPAEVERAAQELFKKFMRMVENKNIANYQPSRARGMV